MHKDISELIKHRDDSTLVVIILYSKVYENEITGQNKHEFTKIVNIS